MAASQGGALVGVVSRTRATAQKFAADHGIGFASDDVDAAARGSPGSTPCASPRPRRLHLEPALAAIRAGKHLMIEKPLDATVEGTDHILREAGKRGVRVGSIFQARFGDAARQFKAAIDAGRFGRMVLASCYVKWNRTREYYTGWKGRLSEDGGGVIINQAIHGVDLLQWFAGMPSEVFAWSTQRVHPIESEDTCVAALKFASGAFGTIEGTTAAWPGWSRRIEICGEHGSAVMEDDDIARWEFRVAPARGRKDPRCAREQRQGFGRGESHGHQFRRPPAADPGLHRRHSRAAAVFHRRHRGAQGGGAGAGDLRFGVHRPASASPGVSVMKVPALFLLAIFLTKAISPAMAADDHSRLLKIPGVKSALEQLRADDARTLREQIEITQIPAPPFKEQVRAADYAARLRAAGLTDVTIDSEGNVIGKRPGKNQGKGPLLVLSAHLDTVFPEGSDVTVKLKDGRYSGLGIIDDSRGLVALLSLLRAMESAKLRTVGDVWFVGTVGEEALGNLRGVKALFRDHPQIDGFISVDGVDSPEQVKAGRPGIVAHATGSRRWEFTFTGPGGHSFGNFGNPSAVHALGRAVARIADIQTSADPKTTFNVGVISGGTGVTAIAAQSTCRSTCAPTAPRHSGRWRNSCRPSSPRPSPRKTRVGKAPPWRLNASWWATGRHPRASTTSHCCSR